MFKPLSNYINNYINPINIIDIKTLIITTIGVKFKTTPIIITMILFIV